MPDFSRFECDKCGACCRSMIVEADYHDALREPRLFEISPTLKRDKFRAGDQCVMLYDTETNACPFLNGETNECGIYATRPQVCVAVEPGDAKCQQARTTKGLPLLRDIDGKEPSLELLMQSCEEYDLDIEVVLESTT